VGCLARMAFQLDPTCLQNLLALAGWPSHLLPSHSQAASMMPRTTNRSGAAACCYETKAGTGLERNLRSHAVTKRSQSRRQTGVCPALEEAVKLRCENLRHRARIKMLTATPVEGTTARHHRGLPRFSHRARRRMGLADTRSQPGRARPPGPPSVPTGPELFFRLEKRNAASLAAFRNVYHSTRTGRLYVARATNSTSIA